MARLNISVPTELYQRLDRIRDRVNASKVCSAALEKELDMVEGNALLARPDDGRVERLVARLRQQQDETQRRFAQGREDGEAWAMETATLNELHLVEQTAAGIEHIDPHQFDPEDVESWEDELPESFLSTRVGSDDDPRRLDPMARSAYVLGWFRGVGDLWKVARARLD